MCFYNISLFTSSLYQSLVGPKGVLGLISKRLLIVVLVTGERVTDLLGVRLLGLGLASRSSRLKFEGRSQR